MNLVDQLIWSPTSKGARPRKDDIDIVVLHWTGGKTSASCLRTLQQRELSVHFTVDHDATIRRHAVPEATVTQHVGSVGKISINAKSIGIEIAHKGFAPSFDGIYKRDEYTDVVHKKPVKLLRYTQAQMDAVRELVRHLCAKYNVPLVLPMDTGEPMTRVMFPDEMKSYRGVAGHLHFEAKKTDPGMEILRYVVKP